MRSRGFAVAVALLVLVLAATVLLAGQSAKSTDDPLANYRKWKSLAQARMVPFELAVQCAPVTETQVEKARKTFGPHTYRWINVYANPLAASALQDPLAKTFPVGAVIAKEKTLAPGDRNAEAVAFMIKRPKGQFVESDGWEFLYRPVKTETANYDGCITCHKASGTKDYVAGNYGR